MVRSRQARWTIGELSPKMIARNDLEFFYSGLDKARDVVIIPEGGFCRRPGSRYIDRQHRKVTRIAGGGLTITAPQGGVTANVNDNDTTTELLTVTNIGVLNPYVVVHYDLGAPTAVAFVDVVGARVTGGIGSATQFFIQGSVDDIVWVSIGAAIPLTTADNTQRRRVRNSTYRYFRFVRIGATDLGANQVALDEFHVWQETATVSEARYVDYKFNIGQNYMLLFTDQNIAVYKDRQFQVDVRSTAFTSDELVDLNRTSGGDTILLFHEDVKTQKLLRAGSDVLWTISDANFENIPLFDFVPVTTNPAATLTPSALTGNVTLTASAAVFLAGHVNQIVEGNGGRARIISFTSTTVVNAIVEIPFYTTSAIAANDWTLETGWEAAWSTARGWPRSGAFHQQRLWIGGSKNRPRTVWASVLGGDFFNFDTGANRDTDAIDADMDNEEPIVNLLAHRTLLIFSTGGESAITQQRGLAITPNNPGIISQTEQGSEPGLRPFVSNGVTLFIQRNGQSISQLVFSDVENAYTAKSVSIYSSHLIRDPVDFVLRRSTNDHETNWIMCVNDDGTIACGSIMTEENIRGFTLWTPADGLYKNIGVDDSDVYVSVERTVNGVTDRYVEVFDFEYFTDGSVQYFNGAPQTVFTGLSHLEGKTVKVKSNNRILDDAVVVGGQITASRAATYVEIGLGWTPQVKLLPYENPEVVGERIGKKIRITDAILRLYETSEVFVNGVPVSLNSFDGNLLDQDLPLFTGEKKIEALRGWDTYGQIEITQENPLPLTVLAIGMEASV